MAIVAALFASGVLELLDHETIPPSPSPSGVQTTSIAGSTQQSLVGSILDLRQTITPTSRSPTPPSLLWKAYAQTLLPFLSLNTDLSNLNQAVFVASPLQQGVPANSLLPEGVTNYQQYLKADCMQTKNVPIYSLGNGSYFEQLWSYLRNVQIGQVKNQLEETRSQLTTAKAAKDEAFDDELNEYEELPRGGQQVPFIDWVRQSEGQYSKAWKLEDALEKKYEDLQDDAMDDVLRALATMKSADSRLDFKIQSNMPCIVTDKDYYVPFKSNPPLSATSDLGPLFYRPYHMLSGYRATAQNWLLKYDPQDLSANRTELALNFAAARTVDWASLGHDGFDKNPSPNSADDIYSSISAKISYVGLQAFDVDRGLWDVNGPRKLPLGPDAPQDLQKPFYKTTKLLLGYGVDLTITLPLAITAADIVNQNNIITLLGIPISQRNVQKNELHVSLGDNAYPVLLAVLAQEV